MPDLSSLIVCQIGAREHYAMASGLHARGRLQQLITDAWVPPESWWRRLPGIPDSLQQRYHPALTDAPVTHFTASLIRFELEARLRRWHGWDRMIQRNRWFQQKVAAHLERSENISTIPPIVFSYSYAARDIFREAKKHGAHTVLGQIDAGPHHEDVLAAQYAQYPEYSDGSKRAPDHYWTAWREECAEADKIIVNSLWSKQALVKAGIAEDKISIVPLIYQPSSVPPGEHRSYPLSFSDHRPLRVLFLGTLSLGKGLGQLLDATKLLKHEPVEFIFVGGGSIDIAPSLQNNVNLRWVGPVPRGEVHAQYEQADVFIFPTLSDGFGLTQLEAQYHGLPIIASSHCGKVVEDGLNGRVLPEVTAEAISEALRWCLDHPDALRSMARASRERVKAFSASQVLPQFLKVVDSIERTR